jgi:hypothetical protein
MNNLRLKHWRGVPSLFSLPAAPNGDMRFLDYRLRRLTIASINS